MMKFPSVACFIARTFSRRHLLSTITGFRLSEPVDFGSNFELPPRLDHYHLEHDNAHHLDENITFDEVKHEYFYQNVLMQTSVTELAHQYFDKFVAKEVIDKMIKGRDWPRKEYMHDNGEALSESEILTKWDSIGEFARNRGTWMHANIERILNKLETSLDVPELMQFSQFDESVIKARNITPYRTEWRIAAPDLGIGGSVDFVGKLEDGSYVIIDWKRSKNLPKTMYVSYGKFARPPICHLPDCDGSKYSLQLNLYRYILMKYYNIPVSKMIIASFHPELSTYFMAEVRVMEKEITALLEAQKNNRQQTTTFSS